MIAIQPVKAAEVLRNLAVSRTQYGRVASMVRLYGISRPTLYRMENRFLKDVCRQRKEPVEDNPQTQEIRQLRKQLELVSTENNLLRAENERFQVKLQRILKKTRFWLIGLGIPARVIARLLRECFNVPANRTDILQLTSQYASQATLLMQKYFHPMAQDADLDEIFVEHDPLYIASEPRGLAILKTSLKEERTVADWSLFLDDMPNLRRTTSDRGQAITGAVARHGGIKSQSDIFHPKMLLSDELRVMESKCYSLMAKEEYLRYRCRKIKRRGRDCRGAAARLTKVARKTREAIMIYDELEAAVQLAYDALRFTTRKGTFNSSVEAEADLQFAKSWIHTHLPHAWKRVKSALDDKNLLTFLDELHSQLPSIRVESFNDNDRNYVLSTLAGLWEHQAQRRYRGKPVLIPENLVQTLQKRCDNLQDVQSNLFNILDNIHRASSGIECINSRVGFYRYSKRRFSPDFANLIAIWHNLSPFEDGKRVGKSPAQLIDVKLPSYDLFTLFHVAA